MFKQQADTINGSFRHEQSELISHAIVPTEIPIRKTGSRGAKTKRIATRPLPSARSSTTTKQPKKTRSHLTKNRVNGIKLGASSDDLTCYLDQALATPLLTVDQERELARQIFGFRRAFQRLILKEPAVIEYLTAVLSKWESKQLRLDAVCNLALSETAKRKTLEPKIVASLKTLRRLPKRIKSAATPQEVRKLHRTTVELVEQLSIRPKPFEESPFQNPKAHQLLQEYRRLCQHMTQANMRLVVQVARQLCGNSPVLLDMIQEGNRGLMHAVTKFDYLRNIRFSTYATPWIKQTIFAALPNSQRNIRVPENFRSLGREVHRRMQGMSEGHPDSARNISLIASEMNLSPQEVTRMVCVQRDTCSLDQPVCGHFEDGLNPSLGELVADQRQTCPLLFAHVRERQQFVRSLMNQSLTQREHDVISLRFGISDGVDRSFAEVGREMGITRERARQVEKRALEKLARITVPA